MGKPHVILFVRTRVVILGMALAELLLAQAPTAAELYVRAARLLAWMARSHGPAFQLSLRFSL